MLTIERCLFAKVDPILRNVAEEVSLPASEKIQTTLKERIEFVNNSQDPEMAWKI